MQQFTELANPKSHRTRRGAMRTELRPVLVTGVIELDHGDDRRELP